MLFCLIIALLSTILWINVTIADILSKDRSDTARITFARNKTALSAIAALFWAIVIRYGGI